MDYFIRWPAQIEYKSLGSPDCFNGGVCTIIVQYDWRKEFSLQEVVIIFKIAAQLGLNLHYFFYL